jgi:hypothetical protein
VTSGWCPGWLGVTLAGVGLDLVGEVGDQLGSFCQVGRAGLGGLHDSAPLREFRRS